MEAATNNTIQTQMTLGHHLHSLLERDLEAALSDYTEDSVLATPDGVFRGLNQLRSFFSQFIETVPTEFLGNFYMDAENVQGGCASIHWSMGAETPLGTVTFLMREGKILMQSYAAYQPL